MVRPFGALTRTTLVLSLVATLLTPVSPFTATAAQQPGGGVAAPAAANTPDDISSVPGDRSPVQNPEPYIEDTSHSNTAPWAYVEDLPIQSPPGWVLAPTIQPPPFAQMETPSYQPPAGVVWNNSSQSPPDAASVPAGFTASASSDGPAATSTEVGGVISSNTTWTAANSPYVVTSSVLIPSGVTLIIDPGVMVKFGINKAMQIDGALVARGTASSPITFTSNSSSPAPGDWAYIMFSDSSTDASFDEAGDFTGGSVLQYAQVEYSSSGGQGAIQISSAAPFIDQSQIVNNKGSGIYATNPPNIRVTNNTFSGNIRSGGPYNTNGGGFTLLGGGGATITGNTFSHNAAYQRAGGITIWGSNLVTVVSSNIVADNIGEGNVPGVGGILIQANAATVTVSNNTITNNWGSSGYGGAAGGIKVRGNNAGVLIDGNTVTGNTFGGGWDDAAGIDLRGASGVTITSNTIANNNGRGIGHGSNSTISGNIISNNTDVGIWQYLASGNNTIRNNVIESNGSNGVLISSASSQAVTSNSILNNAGPGLSITGGSGLIQSNLILGNGGASAISVDSSTWPVNFNNILDNHSAYGLYYSAASGAPLDATNNWWATADETQIQDRIFDWFDDGANGIVNYSPYESSIRTDVPVSPPAGGVATPGEGSISLKWKANPEADIAGYRVHWDTDSGYPYANSVDSGNVTTATVTGLTPGTTYYFAVTGYDTNADGSNDLFEGHESWYSQEVSGTTLTTGTISGTVHYDGPVTGNHNLHVYALLYAAGSESYHKEVVVPFTGPGNYPYSLAWPIIQDLPFPVIVAAVLDANDSGVQVPFNSNPGQPMGLYPKMVFVSAGQQTPGIDIELAVPSSTVSGNIAYTGPATGSVRALLLMGNPFPIVQIASVSANSPYVFPSVPAGTFHVFAWRDINGDGKWTNNEPQGYYGLPGSTQPGSVAVSPGQQVGGIDFSLYDPTTVSGNVTYAGTQISNPQDYDVRLHAHRSFVDENAWGMIHGPGPFTLNNVPAGVYEVGAFLDADGSGGWPPTAGDPNFNSGPTVIVAGNPVSGVNIVLDDIVRGAIFGFVELQGSPGAGGVTVSANGTAGQFSIQSIQSTGYGVYYIYLPVGTYNVSFSYPGYQPSTIPDVNVPPMLAGPAGIVMLPPVMLSQTETTTPNAPTNLSATVQAGPPLAVTLSWTDNSNNETGFRVERSPDGVVFTAVGIELPANATSFIDTTVAAGVTYWYRVTAFNLVGNSAASNVVSVTTPAPPGTAPIAHWKFNDGTGTAVHDDSGNGNDGALILGSLGNTAPSNAWIPGKSGTALSFDGVDDYVSIPNSNVFNFGPADFTIAFWVRFTSVPVPHNVVFLGRNGASDRSWSFFYDTSGNLHFGWQGSSYHDESFPWTASANTWYLLVVKRSGPDLRVLVDNVQVGPTFNIGSDSIRDSSSLFYIAENVEQPGYYLNGSMDDVRIYSYALSAAEIQAILQESVEPGSISGYVYEENGTTPIAGAKVKAWNSPGPYWPWLVGEVLTDSNGRYYIPGLIPGDYGLMAWAEGRAKEFHQETLASQNMTLVTVVQGQQTDNINFTLSPGGTISGNVTDAATGQPLSGVSVGARFADGSLGGGWLAVSDQNGNYVIEGLAYGNYAVTGPTSPRGGPGDDSYVAEYWQEQTTFASATPVTVAEGVNPTGINLTLQQGGSISGHVYLSAGASALSGPPPPKPPAAGAKVEIIDYQTITGKWVTTMSVTADAQGFYQARGLPAKQYGIRVTASGYATEWYQNTYYRMLASPVTVEAGQAVENIDFSLETGGAISGLVTSEQGQPIANLHVYASDYQSNQWTAGANTNVSGVYTITGVPAGNYRLRAVPSNNALPYVDEYYNDTYDSSKAAQVPVTASANTTNIDFVLAQGGIVSGTVRDQASGQALANISLDVTRTDGPGGWGVTTSQNGSYSVLVPPGLYRVNSPGGGRWGAADSNYIREYYNNRTTQGSADLVTVSANSSASGIDFTLEMGGSVSGNVTNAQGQPVASLNVTAYDFLTGQSAGGVNTKADGTYVLPGLPAANYKIMARPSNNSLPYSNEYYKDTYASNNATPVAVVSGQDTPDISFILEPAGAISGKVSDQLTGGLVNDDANGSIDLAVGWHKLVYLQEENGGGQTARVAFKAPGDTEWKKLSTANLQLKTSPSTDAGSGIILITKKNTWTRQPVSHNELEKCVTQDSTEEPGWYGQSVVTIIEQSENIHGNDDYYTSYYETYFYVESPGTWQFSVTSDDSSEVMIDSTVVAYWYMWAWGNDRWEHRASVGVLDSTGKLVGNKVVNADGTYTIGNLMPGNYRVEAMAPGYLPEFYQEKSSLAQADLVPVAGGATTPNINFTLDRGGSISGNVADQQGQPLAGISIDATRTDGPGGGGATTDANGNYTVSSLPFGKYRVNSPSQKRYGSGDDGYATEYYSNKSSQGNADMVAVSANSSDVTGIDFSLEMGGSISGHVYDSNAPAEMQAGPVTPIPGFGPDSGFPDYYQDDQGTRVALLPITGDGLNAPTQIFDNAIPANPYSAFLGFGTEAFYYGAFLQGLDTGTGTFADIEFDIEAVFMSPLGEAELGQETVMNRTRIRFDVPVSGDYTVRTPYGERTFTGVVAGAPGFDVNFTEDILGAPRDFATAATGSVNRFLHQAVPPPPAGWIGDGVTIGPVTGSPTAFNKVRITGPAGANLDGAGNNFVESDQWTIAGRLAGAGGSAFAAASTGAPIANLHVYATDYQTGQWMAGVNTDANGAYVLRGLPAGTYRVRAAPSNNSLPYAGEYYNDTYDYNMATPVAVSQPGDTANIDFMLAAAGTISGKVENEQGQPIANLHVFATDYQTNLWMAGANTGADGKYTLKGLPAGSYRVRAYPPNTGQPYLDEFFNDTRDYNLAAQVQVTPPGDTSNINFILSQGGSISGRVTDEGGYPIANLSVYAVDYATGKGKWSTNTLGDGTYVLTGLPGGFYRVATWVPPGLPYAAEYYNDTYDYNGASVVQVFPSDDTPNINFALAPGGSISGTVSDQATGQALADISLDAQRTDGFGWGTRTDQNGNYSFSGLPQGQYRVNSPSGGRWGSGDDGYLREYYSNKADWNSADLVIISTGSSNVTDINFSLEVGGSISGVVTNDKGQPIKGAHVDALVFDTNEKGWHTETDDAGRYQLTGLPTGEYRVIAWAPDHVRIYWPDTLWHHEALPVAVTQPGDTPNINFVLGPGGAISGTVKDQATGEPLSNISVEAGRTDGPGGSGANTDQNGNYAITGLPFGDYRVNSPSGGRWGANDGNYVREYYSNKADQNSADLVTISANSSTAGGIHFSLEIGGSVSGVVSNDTGQPIKGAKVGVSPYESGMLMKTDQGANTDENGFYRVPGIPSGDFRVQVWAPGYVQQFHGDGYDWKQSTSVHVTAGSETPNINFVMETAGTIQGQVVSANDGSPLAGISVEMLRVDGPGGWGETTDENGYYKMSELPFGQYKVRSPSWGRWGSADDDYIREYYNNKADQNNADVITISASSPRADGIDFSLEVGGSITGHVYDAANLNPIGGAAVALFAGPAPYSVVATTNTDAAGAYKLPALPPGEYILRAMAKDYARQYYNGRGAMDEADAIDVAVSSAVVADFHLVYGAGTISGTVYEGNSTKPVANALVLAHISATGGLVGGARSDSAGKYKITSLAPGEYKVKAEGAGHSEWYSNKGAIDQADAVTVVSLADTPNVNFTLGGIDWAIRLMASASVGGGFQDPDNFAGTALDASPAHDAYDILNAPSPPSPYLDLMFPHPDWGQHAGNYAADIRIATASMVWRADVTNVGFVGNITISWDVSQVPPAYKTVLLKDLATGALTDMRSSASYTYAETAGSVRSFDLILGVQVTRTATLQAGWNMFSLPVNPFPVDWGYQLGDDLSPLYLYYYDPLIHGYKVYPMSGVPLNSGTGYWVHTGTSTVVDVEGYVVPDAPFAIHLPAGWNMIGDPFLYPVDWGNVLVYNNTTGETVTIEEAHLRNWVSKYMYGYDPEVGGYQMYAAPDGQLDPWQAYWVKAMVEVDLILNPRLPLPQADREVNLDISISRPANGTYFAVGEQPVFTVTVMDQSGQPFNRAGDLSQLRLMASGPVETTDTTTAAKLLKTSTDRSQMGHHYAELITNADVQEDNGVLIYRLGAVSDEKPGTYTASLWAVSKANGIQQAMATVDFQIGTSVVEDQIVEKEKCASCHQGADNGKFYLRHIDPLGTPGSVGSWAIDQNAVRNCKACHNNEGYAAYRDPANPDLRIPDTAVNRVHGVHMGEKLLNPSNTDPMNGLFRNYTGSNFPANVKNCASCHVDDRWKTKPSRLACGTCHDNAWFGDLASKPASMEAHVGGPQPNDLACALCHTPDTGGVIPISVAHTVSQMTNSVAVSLTPPANGKFYTAGEHPAVTIVVNDDNGSPIDHTKVDATTFASSNLFVYGPRENTMPVLTSTAKNGNSKYRAAVTNSIAASGTPTQGWSFASGDTFKIAVNGGPVQELAAASGLQTPDQVRDWLKTSLSNVTVTSGNTSGTVTIRSNIQGSRIEIYNSPVTTKMGWKPGGLPLDRGGMTPGVTMEPYVIQAGGPYPNNDLRKLSDPLDYSDPKVTRTVENIAYALDDVAGLTPGTYSIYVWTQPIAGKTPNVSRTAFGFMNFQVGTDAPDKKIATNCANCHGDAIFHLDDGPQHPEPFDTDYCKACHDYSRFGTGSSFARLGGTSTSGWSGFGVVPIVRRIHGLHFGRYLDRPEEIYAGNPNAFNEVIFPQDVRNCTSCHDASGSLSWKEKPSRLACMACHDSDSAKSHANTMTQDPTPEDPYGGDETETCNSCHGKNSDYSADKVHNISSPYKPPYPREPAG